MNPRRIAVLLSLLALAAGLTFHDACTRAGEPEGVRRISAALTTDYAAVWSQLDRIDGGSSLGPSVAAIVTASRGTELFSVSSSQFGVFRTRSNIELSVGGTGTLTSGQDSSAAAMATADGGTSIDLFWRDQNQSCVTRAWNGTSFSSIVPVGGTFLAGFGAAGTTNRVDVFGVGLNHTLWHATRSGTAWTGLTNELAAPPGLTLASVPPAALWRSGGVLHVFALASDSSVWTRRYQNGWSAWSSLGTSPASGFSSGVSAVLSGTNRIDLLAVSVFPAQVFRRYSTDGGTTWVPSGGSWEAVGAPPLGIMNTTIDGVLRYLAPAAVARADSRIDLFVRDGVGAIQLMTIRPAATLAGDRTIALSCSDAAGWENTAAALPTCSSAGYEFLAYGAGQRILRVGTGCFDSSAPSSCVLPSGSNVGRCSPFEIRFPGSANYGSGLPGTDVPISGVTLYNPGGFDSNDNQIVRLSNNHLIAVRGSHICSPVTCNGTPGTHCTGGRTATGAMLAFRSTDCGGTWTQPGTADPCALFGLAGCHQSGTGCDVGQGFDRQEVHGRGNDLFMAVQLFADVGGQVLLKSTNEGASWTEWLANSSGRIDAAGFTEVSSAGSHVARFGFVVPSTPTLWVQSADTAQNPVKTTLPFGDCVALGGLFFSGFAVTHTSSSADGDYVRVAYPVSITVGGVATQATKTGLVRLNANQTATALTNTFTTITASTSGGSILFPALIDADRISGPSGGDERPPVLLFWVESTGTPANTSSCVSSPCAAWGNITVKAVVFRGASQSTTITIPSGQPSTTWTGNGDYVHGASFYRSSSSSDRFFVHWLNQGNGAPGLMSEARIVDVAR